MREMARGLWELLCDFASQSISAWYATPKSASPIDISIVAPHSFVGHGHDFGRKKTIGQTASLGRPIESFTGLRVAARQQW
jgi:hypothetical protein